jgi:hypothetical protein
MRLCMPWWCLRCDAARLGISNASRCMLLHLYRCLACVPLQRRSLFNGGAERVSRLEWQLDGVVNADWRGCAQLGSATSIGWGESCAAAAMLEAACLHALCGAQGQRLSRLLHGAYYLLLCTSMSWVMHLHPHQVWFTCGTPFFLSCSCLLAPECTCQRSDCRIWVMRLYDAPSLSLFAPVPVPAVQANTSTARGGGSGSLPHRPAPCTCTTSCIRRPRGDVFMAILAPLPLFGVALVLHKGLLAVAPDGLPAGVVLARAFVCPNSLNAGALSLPRGWYGTSGISAQICKGLAGMPPQRLCASVVAPHAAFLLGAVPPNCGDVFWWRMRLACSDRLAAMRPVASRTAMPKPP